MRRLCVLGLVILGICLEGHAIRARQNPPDPPPDPIVDAKGVQHNRNYLSLLPFESIDTLSGNVLLSFTDLVLPGNGGLDVRIVRSFNSKGPASWSFGLGGYPFRVENPQATPPNAPRLLLADGARIDLFRESPGSSVFRSREFWRYSVSGQKLQLPNGSECFFSASGDLTKVKDPFNNEINLTYRVNGELEKISQNLGNAQVREITFGSGGTGGKVPSSMSYLNRTWSYSVDSAGRLFFVDPPVGSDTGAEWRYEYELTTPLVLTAVIMPNQGRIQYDFRSTSVVRNGVSLQTRVLYNRDATWSSSLPTASWNFTYSYVFGESTTVEGPDATMTVYTFGPEPNAGEPALQRLQRYRNFILLEDESRTYRVQPVTTSGAGFALLPATRTIHRNGSTYTTTYSYHETNFADYGRPHSILETGQLQRTTSFVFDYDFDPSRWIKDKVASTTLTMGGESFQVSRSHQYATGFMDSETRYGITTTYTPDLRGNVASATDTHGHTTNFSYFWGALSTTSTPEYDIARAIDPDGTVRAEMRRGFVTTYDYDDIGRQISVTPPIGLEIKTEYHDGYVREVRTDGQRTSSTRSYLDGFGRVALTENSMGVRRSTRYDAFGRKSFESLPYEQGMPLVGTTYRYDGIDRLIEQQPTGGAATTFGYEIGHKVRITEPNTTENRVTVQTWAAFGDPEDARLVEVTDAENGLWAYQYNALGRLTSVIAPLGSPRVWTYYPGTDLLQSEGHPESGTTGYTYEGSRLHIKSNNRGQFVYGYDNNDRVTSVSAPGLAHPFTLGYDDSDNRTLLQNGYVRSVFWFDGADRLKWRRDTIQDDSADRTTTYSYNGWDDLTQIIYPSNLVVNYEYDTASRVTKVLRSGASLPVAEVLEYHPSGAVESLRLGNSLVQTFQFDPNRYWTTRIAGGPLNLCYEYFPVGNVQAIKDFDGSAPNCQSAGGTKSQQFGYDKLDRLTYVGGDGGGFYQYDAVGNRRTKEPGTLIYNYDFGNRLRSVTGPQGHPEVGLYGFNTAGDMLSDPTGNYTYTPFGMLETATVGANQAAYRYDGDNVRKVKFTNTEERFYFHGAGNQLLSEYRWEQNGSRWMRDYIYLGGRLVASLSDPTTVGFTTAASTVTEGVGQVTATVTLITSDGGSLQAPVSVAWATEAGTATANGDFASASGTITFPTGSFSGATQNVQVQLYDDATGDGNVSEPDETFRIRLSSPQNASLATTAVHTVTIVDNEPWLAGHIDIPQSGTHFTPFVVGGWAIDRRATTNTGIDIVRVYAQPAAGGPPTLLGVANYGPRPDIAGTYGSQFLHSGFGFSVGLGALPLGVWDVAAEVHFTSNDTWQSLPANRITIVPSAVAFVDAAPGTVNQRFNVTGYALDRAATSGTAITVVEVSATPAAGGNPIPLGNATLGVARPDAAAAYGGQFASAGYTLEVTGLMAGTYTLNVRAHSSLTGWSTTSRAVTIQTSPVISFEAPANGSTTGQPFLVGGWAVDTAAATGPGVSTVHVWAAPLGGGGAVFLGAHYGGVRPDVASYFGNSQFTNSGFTLPSVMGLAPGTWTITAHALSTVTGQFSGTASKTITIPTPNAFVAIDAPTEGATVGQPLFVSGWAVDWNSPNTVGIGALHVYAYPWSGDPTPRLLNVTPVYAPRPDVAAAYGAHRLNSGWGLHSNITLPPGTYTIIAYPISTGNQVVAGAGVRVVTVQ